MKFLDLVDCIQKHEAMVTESTIKLAYSMDGSSYRCTSPLCNFIVEIMQRIISCGNLSLSFKKVYGCFQTMDVFLGYGCSARVLQIAIALQVHPRMFYRTEF